MPIADASHRQRPRPELRHLRYFVAVAEELNFTRAADRLFIGQPSLSAQVKELERRLGCELLTRSTRRVELTRAGVALLPRARSLLTAADRAARAAREAGRLGDRAPDDVDVDGPSRRLAAVPIAAAAEVPSRRPIRVVLADGQHMVRAGVRMLLEATGSVSVVGEACDIEGSLRALRLHIPDVLVLEATLPGARTSLELLPSVQKCSPPTATVVLAEQDDPRVARQALRAGALGFIAKNARDFELIDAVTAAAQSRAYLDPSLAAGIAALPAGSDAPPDNLSKREVEVLQLLARGHTNAAIGSLLQLSTRTVETHRACVQLKLRRTKRAQLVCYAFDQGLMAA